MKRIAYISLLFLILFSCKKDEFWPMEFVASDRGETILINNRNNDYSNTLSFKYGIRVDLIYKTESGIGSDYSTISDLEWDGTFFNIPNNDITDAEIVDLQNTDFWSLEYEPSGQNLSYDTSVEVIKGHTYLIKFGDGALAKVRVSDMSTVGFLDNDYSWVSIFWQYGPWGSFDDYF